MNEYHLLVGDVGGTNTNLGVMSVKGKKYTLIDHNNIDSHKVTDFTKVVSDFLESFLKEYPECEPIGGCISGAGPVHDNRIKMTNQSWVIDGNDIKKALGIPTVIINDFAAVSFSLPLLDTNDTSKIIQIPRIDGSKPKGNSQSPRLALGPGTGLGVGLLVPEGNGYVALPSEGGHMDFSAWDDQTFRLKTFLEAKIGKHPGYEPVISGIGINNLFHFFDQEEKKIKSQHRDELRKLDDKDRPRRISELSKTDPMCKAIFQLFVKILARFCSNLSAGMMPIGGLFIAGGISAKNLDHFTEDNLFMEFFEDNYNSHIIDILSTIPVYVIMDYGISLLGAAHGAQNLLGLPIS